MRKLLGLDCSDDGDDDDDIDGNQAIKDDERGLIFTRGKSSANNDDDDDDSFFGSGNKSDDNDSHHDEEEGTQSFTYTPGKLDLEEKIRNKLNDKNKSDEANKELTPWEKYQLKRKEKRKEKKKRAKETKMEYQGIIASNSLKNDDAGLVADKEKLTILHNENRQNNAPSSKEELDLLLAGDNGEYYF